MGSDIRAPGGGEITFFLVRVLLINWTNKVCVASRRGRRQSFNQAVKGEKQKTSG